MVILRDAAWEAETQGAPRHLLLPVLLLADAIHTSYMKMGAWWGSKQGLFMQPQGFPLPCLSCFPLASFPGKETEKGQCSRLRPGEQRAPCHRQPGQSAEPASQACSFLLLFLPLCFFVVLGAFTKFYKDFYPRTKF